MITFPEETVLIGQIRESLDSVAGHHQLSAIADAEWFPEIASEIASRVKGLGLKSYARGSRRSEPAKECIGTEWLFDFCALIYDDDVPEHERYMAQAAIVGEIEWSLKQQDIEDDFHKLLIADSLVCFFAFQAETKGEADEALASFAEAAERRRNTAKLRGLSQPPQFLLSCYLDSPPHFVHLVVPVT